MTDKPEEMEVLVEAALDKYKISGMCAINLGNSALTVFVLSVCLTMQLLQYVEFKEGDAKRAILQQAEEKCQAAIIEPKEDNTHVILTCQGCIFRHYAKMATDFETQSQFYQKVCTLNVLLTHVGNSKIQGGIGTEAEFLCNTY
jgi:hypothetical protein